MSPDVLLDDIALDADMLDASAVVLVRDLLYGTDDVLFHDLFYETDMSRPRDIRSDFPPVPWWRREGSRIVGRIGDQIVETCDLDAPPQTHHPREVAQVRGVLAERVVISSNLDPFLSLKALADYSGFSRRTLLNLIAGADPMLPVLPHYRVGGGKIVVRRSDWDAWMQQFRHTQSRMDELIDERRRQHAARRMARAER